MSSEFAVHIGPFVEWLVTHSHAQGCTDELNAIVEREGLNVNINGMFLPPRVPLDGTDYFRVCGFPYGERAKALCPRRMYWTEYEENEAIGVDLSAVDREKEVAWFTSTFASGVAAFTEYFGTPARRFGWGFVAARW